MTLKTRKLVWDGICKDDESLACAPVTHISNQRECEPTQMEPMAWMVDEGQALMYVGDGGLPVWGRWFCSLVQCMEYNA